MPGAGYTPRHLVKGLGAAASKRRIVETCHPRPAQRPPKLSVVMGNLKFYLVIAVVAILAVIAAKKVPVVKDYLA